jgi:hypothetical protein
MRPPTAFLAGLRWPIWSFIARLIHGLSHLGCVSEKRYMTPFKGIENIRGNSLNSLFRHGFGC